MQLINDDAMCRLPIIDDSVAETFFVAFFTLPIYGSPELANQATF